MVLLFLYPILLFFVVQGFDRNEMSIILLTSVLLSLYFYYLEKQLHWFQNRFWPFFFYCIVLRSFVLGSNPYFSDDIFRYLFDAKLILNGFSPYDLTPTDWALFYPLDSFGLKEFYAKMNSPNYYSVYPIFLLMFYVLGSILNLILDTNFLGVQIVFLMIDVLNGFLIRKYYQNESNHFYWLYFGNPIIIIEGISQMHPEILLIPWILLLLQKNPIWKRGTSLLVLTQLKINTVIFMLGVTKNRKYLLYLGLGFVCSLIIWKVTVFSNLDTQAKSGLGMFFHSFRFAGILEPFFYYPLFVFKISYLSGFVSLGVCGFVLSLLFLKKSYNSLTREKRILVVYSLFLLFSPVIHPWYWIVFFLLGMINKINTMWISFLVFFAFFSYLIYVSELYFYLYWFLFLSGIGIYGSTEINHLRKTTSIGRSENTTRKNNR